MTLAQTGWNDGSMRSAGTHESSLRFFQNSAKSLREAAEAARDDSARCADGRLLQGAGGRIRDPPSDPDQSIFARLRREPSPRRPNNGAGQRWERDNHGMHPLRVAHAEEANVSRFTASVIGLVVLSSWACSSGPTSPDEVTTRATVRFVDVEGGCWRLDAASGISYDPVGLPPAFRIDGRRVVVTLRFPGDVGSLCQVGVLAKVVSIRDR